MGNISQELLDGIEILIKKYLENYSYTRCQSGLIINIDTNTKLYNVVINGKELKNLKALNEGEITYSVNNAVMILFPENQTSQAIILGKI